MRRFLALVPLVALVLSACTGSVTQTKTSMVTIDGSSTVFPITEAMAEEFQKGHPGVNVVVGIAGTGGGFKRFCRGETHINDASRPIKAAEKDACKEGGVESIELPIAYDGLAVMVNPENSWVDYLTVAELKKIWEPEAQGVVTRWKNIRSTWPDEPINLYGPGVDSGTYDYFTEAIVGKEGSSRGDFTASEDDNTLVQGIAADANALGFFGYAYYKENKDKLKLVPVTGAEKGSLENAVLPSPQTINDGSYKPLSRPLFLYVAAKAAEDPVVAQFVDFYLDAANVERLVTDVGYVPLPETIYQLSRKRFAEKVAGSIFEGGSKAGVTLEQLLQGESR